MSNLGDFLTNVIQRGRQGDQDRATLNTLAQMDQDNQDNAGDQLAQRGKQAQAIRGVIASYSDNPDVGHALKSMSVDQLEGVMHGVALKQAADKMAAENQRAQAETTWYNQRAQESSAEAEALPQFASQFQNALAQYGPPNARAMDPFATGATPALNSAFAQFANQGGPVQATPDQVRNAALTAMANMGRTNPRMAGVMIKTLLPSITGQEDLTPGSYTDPVTGAEMMYRGKTAFPAGFSPKVLGQQQPIPQIMDGKLMGFSTFDPRGHGVFHSMPADANWTQATDDRTGQLIPGQYMDSAGKPHDARDAMEKAGWVTQQDGTMVPMVHAQQPAGFNASGEPPKVTTQAQYDALPPGAVYVGKDGKTKYQKPK